MGKCIVCGHSEFVPFLENLMQCRFCKFVTANADGIDFNEIYEEKYFKGGEYPDYLADEKIIKKNFLRRLNDVLKYKEKGRLLEIGSAYGFFLDLARNYFKDVIGFEICHEAAEYGRQVLGLDIRKDDFCEVSVDSLGGKFDVTVMWDVIEHLERPDRILSQIQKLSHKDGMLFLTTGNIASLNARLRGHNWRLIHPPTHLHYFSPDTISILFEKYGFKVIEIKHVGSYRSLKLMLYMILVLRMKKESLYRFLNKILPMAMNIKINFFDIMQVIGKKYE